ncbi:ABC transporter substrate-binding protein [Magnetococcales bacterium HHB-1]
MKLDPASGELIPALATHFQWISPTIIEFDLRPGVTFHNGEPFNAEAVKFSFERMAAVTDGFNWIQAIIPEFERVEIISPLKVRIHFRHHNSIFLISSRFFIILPPVLLKTKGTQFFREHPVGTGPFAFKRIVHKPNGETAIHLERNQRYWDPQIPKLDHLIFHFGIDQKQSLKRLISGELDAIADLPIRRLLEARKAGLKTPAKGQGLISWLYFNLTRHKEGSPVWSPEVRHAIAHAIDYQRILKVVYHNRATINQQWAFPGLPGHVNNLPNYSYDLNRARKLLTKAGYPNGFKLNMYCDDVSLDEAKIIKGSLAKLNIEVHIDILDEATNNCILTSRRQPNSPCHNRLKYYDMMMGDFGWGLPHNYVSHLHTFSLNSFASMVADHYPDAKRTITMFKAAKRAFGKTKATAKWEEITAYEHRRLGLLGIVLKNTYFATRPDLEWSVFGAYDFSHAHDRPSLIPPHISPTPDQTVRSQ